VTAAGSRSPHRRLFPSAIVVAYFALSMSGKKPTRRKASPSTAPRPTTEIAAELLAVIERDGAILKSEVGKRASRMQILEVFDALVSAGFEVSGRFVRRSLDAQLEERAREAPTPLRGLEKIVKGATAREIGSAADALVARRRAAFVVRGKDLLLTRPDAVVLDGRERERLAKVVTEIVSALRFATKHRASVLRSDLEDSLKPFLPASASPIATKPSRAALEDVASFVDEHREPSGLTSVPKLVRLLGGAAARDALHAELLRGARAGRFELRPESGMGRLSVEDASFCIPGPQGSRLSWVRRIEESS
jgi:hypothetical protein